MAEPKKHQQKLGHPGAKHANDATDTLMEKMKSQDKYKSDVLLQSNQTLPKTTRPGPSLRAEGDWADAVPKTAKTLAGKIEFSRTQQEPEELWSPDPEEMLYDDIDYDMSPEDTDTAYYEYIKTQNEDCEN